MRAFIALPVAAAVQSRLGKVMRELDAVLPRNAVRWSCPEQIHLTLRFLGETPADSRDEVAQRLRVACEGSGPLTLHAAEFGVFPEVLRPRVLWIGVAGELEELLKLERRVMEAMADFGMPEERDFHAHLTLGRVRKIPSRELRRVVAALAKFRVGELGAWTADCVQLMRSELSPDGSRYTELASIPLAAA